MSASAFEQSGSYEEIGEQSQPSNKFIAPETGANPEPGSPGGLSRIPGEEFSFVSGRLSNLSSGLMEVLADLERIIRTSADQLAAIQAAVDLKEDELKRLHQIDAAAETLEQILESQRTQKENFEAQIESERRAWDEEKARRVQEENAYVERLNIQRQLEEEEYKRTLEEEKVKALQQLEEELRLIQQENRLKQEAIERDCVERELAMKEKELEWAQLIQELEQFMSKLTQRVQSRTGSV